MGRELFTNHNRLNDGILKDRNEIFPWASEYRLRGVVIATKLDEEEGYDWR